MKWKLHTLLVGLPRWAHPFSRDGSKRLLFLCHGNHISRTQFFPYFFASKLLRERWNVELRERPMASFQAQTDPEDGIYAVFFQTGFDLENKALEDLCERLRALYPGAKLVYLDWFAPTDLRYAEVLCTRVDLYLKKHLLRDRSQYGMPTIGDTKLTDHYCRRFGLAAPQQCFAVPKTFHHKLLLGPNFCCTPSILRLARRNCALDAERPVDLHARIATKGVPWYTHMRIEAQEAVDCITGLNVVAGGKISYRQYIDELRRSKMCFSPFGYGEVCWRDFEAAATGSLLLKPDMAHVETEPDLYVPGDTYIPLPWDLRGLAERCAECAADPALRQRVTRNAFELVRTYALGSGLRQHLERLMNHLSIT